MSGVEAAMLMLVGCLALLASAHRISSGDDGPWGAVSAAESQAAADEVVERRGAAEVVLPAVSGLASQMMIRTARGNRQYDVPQIECPPTDDEVMDRFACPTPDRMRRYRCIDDHVLCDGFMDCPNGEDEDRQACMFYKTTKAHLDILADALLRWARGR
ncbi:LDLa [Nesidiocoris tenuis]|uniref:LDLa n=1 Tax=Nesidiocoris tenuis TaxID=355587 RepID=A0ABN7AQK1_9HEMI|nr:LDLa [Nesidiocoris tenuis]